MSSSGYGCISSQAVVPSLQGPLVPGNVSQAVALDHPFLLGCSGIPTKHTSEKLLTGVAFSPTGMMNLSGAEAASSASSQPSQPHNAAVQRDGNKI